MIHYTLLPEKEIRALKKEYRIRFFVVLLFFVSFAVFVGIVSLIPSYVFSYMQEKQALNDLQSLQDSRRERGTDAIMKDLSDTQQLVNKLKNRHDPIVFSQVIAEIIERKSSQVALNSFQINQSSTASSTLDVSIQGTAQTRDSLLAFRESLEQNPFISKIDLPISDLAKSRDISFALKLTIQTE
jgi:heme exporter protein D